MAVRSAVSPDIRAFEPSTETTTLDQIIAGNPLLAGMRYESGVNDDLRRAAYLGSLGDAQKAQLALNHQDLIGKITGDAVNQGANYIKAGSPEFLDSILRGTAGMSLGAIPQTARMAAAGERLKTVGEAEQAQGTGLMNATKGGYAPVQPDGAMSPDFAEPGALRAGYVNPADQARMVAAQKQPDAVTATRNVGDVTVSSKGKTADQAMSGLGTASGIAASGGQPARGNPVTGGIKGTPMQNSLYAAAGAAAAKAKLPITGMTFDSAGVASFTAGNTKYRVDPHGNRLQ